MKRQSIASLAVAIGAIGCSALAWALPFCNYGMPYINGRMCKDLPDPGPLHTGDTYVGVCSYNYCDKTVGCSTDVTKYQRKKRTRQMFTCLHQDDGYNFRTDGNPTDILDGCCYCETSYLPPGG